MFRPERLSLLQIVVLDDDIMATCECLIRQKIVHLVDRKIVAPALREGTPSNFSSTQAELELLLENLHTLGVWSGDEGREARKHCCDKNEIKIEPEQLGKKIQPTVDKILAELAELDAEAKSLEAEIAELKSYSDTLQSFETAGVSYKELLEFNYFTFLAGKMPQKYLPDLRRSLHQIPYHIEVRQLDIDEVSLIVLCPVEVKDTLRNALSSLFFSEIDIPKKYQQEPHSAMDDVELELWDHREALALINAKLKKLRRENARNIAEWYNQTAVNLQVLNAMQLFGKTSQTTFINGWVPNKNVAKISSELKTLLKERVVIEITNPDEDTGFASELIKRGKLQPPTKFKHPAFLKPFAGLVTTFGYPEYNGIDPTLFVAMTFVLMFGMMFGDVGHGLVISALGLFIAKSKLTKNISSSGWVMFTVGLSAIFFGFMYGSFFGFEDVIIKHVWLSPCHQLPTLLISSIILGTIILSLGLILNVVQSFMQKNYQEALFGQYGLLSSIFYWMMLGTVYIAAVSGINIGPGYIIVLLLAPIILIILGDIFYAKLFPPAPDAHHEQHEIAEVLFKPAEIVLGFLTNTVSFVRVGAFALNHSVLMLVIFVLAEMGGGFVGPEANFTSRTSYVVSLIAGNIFVMLLEGLVVFIQCLRLEYYEFFSKFFKGEGLKYAPFKIEKDN